VEKISWTDNVRNEEVLQIITQNKKKEG